MNDHNKALSELTGHRNATSLSETSGVRARPVYRRASDPDLNVQRFGQPVLAEKAGQITTDAEFKAVLARLEPQELGQFYLLCTRT